MFCLEPKEIEILKKINTPKYGEVTCLIRRLTKNKRRGQLVLTVEEHEDFDELQTTLYFPLDSQGSLALKIDKHIDNPQLVDNLIDGSLRLVGLGNP